MTGKKKIEPKLSDVLAATQALGSRLTIETRHIYNAIQELDHRLTTQIQDVFEIMGSRFLKVENKLIAIHERVDYIDEHLGDVERRLGKVEGHVLDMQDDLKGALSAIDGDSVKILDHEKRIRRLEKVR